jgi:ABC-type transporter Mla subunit MlaD
MRHSHLSRAVATATSAVAFSAACGSTTPPSAGAFCSEIAEINQLGVSLTGDATELAQAVGDLEDLADVAPAEVRPSVKVLADALAAMSQAVNGSRGDASEAIDAAMGALAPVRDEVEQASVTVESYTQQNCNFSLLEPDTTESP